MPSGTTLTFTTDTVCTTGGVAFGGAAVSIQIELESGFTLNAFGGGWGTSYWSRGPWGACLFRPRFLAFPCASGAWTTTARI